MKQRSRDRRSPSGSGWGKALAKREVPPAKAGQPLARETSAGNRHRSRQSQGRKAEAQRHESERASGSRREVDRSEAKATAPWQLPGSESSRGERSAQAHARGVGSLAAPRPESLLQDEAAVHGGIGRSRGRARGLFGLQKSTSGVWSMSKDMGLALWLSLWEAQRAKQRRKPDRSGESHEHASSEIGDRLPVSPRGEGESWRRAGGGRVRRWKVS
jgi:hypothetical protein